MNHYYALIMAGGGGTRLWPMSRQDTPKQLLPLVEDVSMFRTTVDRLLPLFPADHIYVATGRKYVEAMRRDAPEIPLANFVTEPYGRNSGPAAGLGAAIIQKRDPDAIIAIMTSDHHIAKQDVFREVLKAAHDLAQQGYIATLGISPSYPATGFGYIRQGETLANINGFDCYHSRGFTEKPDPVTATAFVASGEFSWNSGMFIWQVSRAMNEFERQQPEMFAQLTELVSTLDTPEYETKLNEIWAKIKDISLDYAVMEDADKIAVIPIDIGWNDVGSWVALFDVLKLDKFGNCFKGSQPEKVILDTKNTLVYSDKLTVTIGVEDIIVVETPDALLICNKNRAENVKEVVNYLLTTKNYKYL
ncbi:MAG: mannose-1-phosphate guanylyltransferase [Anaerolineaceae bacterium]|nr:mannose-1-phosphate guanylyltransferase [Anaerolineaceae bacterium]